jgi:hypothetical protein
MQAELAMQTGMAVMETKSTMRRAGKWRLHG